MIKKLTGPTLRNVIISGLATTMVLVNFAGEGTASPLADQFSISLGRGRIGYSTYGRGRYGYGNGWGNGYSANRRHNMPLYGRGPYGYHTGYQNGYGYGNGYGNRGYSGWNQRNLMYTPYRYNSNNSPYTTWGYSPYGFGLQQTYGW